MSLAAGARLGPYEIVSPLGAGGMGEVYRAKDGRLNRTVAIKILSDESAADADHRERFEREAKAISALDHPNICALYDVGEHEDTYFLVMPCLEGQTLADRLAKGPLPPDQAIKCAIEIATALDAAHRHGIIHRDLKPGNIMLTKTGVKLLDFGLAKLKKAAGPLGDTTMVKGTGVGTLLGTMPYMAPEQIEGREVDARSDIFSLGAVIYEMVTGQRAFKGESPASVIGAILKDEPAPMKSLQPLAPAALDHVVTTCLAKDPDERWQSAADIARELKWIAHADASSAESPATTASAQRWLMPIAAALFGAIVVALLGSPISRPAPADVVRFLVAPPADTRFTSGRSSLGILQFAISPDGRQLAFVAAQAGGQPRLWVRGLSEVAARELSATEDAADPFWSPDSSMIGYFAHGRLKTIDPRTNEIRDICMASLTPRGGAWNKDGIIVFGGDSGSGFSRVSTATRVVETATTGTPQANSHRWPSFLPDSNRFLFYARGDREHRGIYLSSLDGAPPVRILETMFNGIYASGYLMTMRDGAIVAYPFDERSARITGDPVQIADHVAGTSTQRGAFDASATGVLVHAGGGYELSRLSWFDRAGKETPIAIPPASILTLRLSPDDRRVAMTRVDPAVNATDVWLADLDRAATTRFTLGLTNDLSPVWSPDGARIVFRSDRAGDNFLYGKASTSGGAEEQLTSFNASNPTDWSRDGKHIVFHQSIATTNMDIQMTPPAMSTQATVLVNTAFDEYDARFSPDGKWLAYVSDESGRREIYVQTFPVSGDKWTISTAGGTEPRWRGDGRELFYLALDGKLMAAEIHATTAFDVGTLRALFQTRIAPTSNPFHSSFDVAGDGNRFLMKTPVDSVAILPLTVVVNWRSSLIPGP